MGIMHICSQYPAVHSTVFVALSLYMGLQTVYVSVVQVVSNCFLGIEKLGELLKPLTPHPPSLNSGNTIPNLRRVKLYRVGCLCRALDPPPPLRQPDPIFTQGGTYTELLAQGRAWPPSPFTSPLRQPDFLAPGQFTRFPTPQATRLFSARPIEKISAF